MPKPKLLYLLRSCLLSLLLILILSGLAQGGSPPLIRVKLDHGPTQSSFKVTNGSYNLVDASNPLQPLTTVNPGQTWQVSIVGAYLQLINESGQTLTSTGILFIEPRDPNGLNVFSYKGTQYRTKIEFQNVGGKLLVINTLDLESYLYGVIGQEIGNAAPDEALKTQAVVARSYAMYKKKHPDNSLGYDVTTGTDSQVYRGYTAELSGGARVVSAVQNTMGQVIMFNGAIINAVFHSNAGGYTENSENIWTNSLPYLRAVASPEDESPLSQPQLSSGWPANTYQWSKTMSRSVLEQKFQIGMITDIRLYRHNITLVPDPQTNKTMAVFNDNVRTPSGRVTKVEITGTTGQKILTKDGIRYSTNLDLKSTLFEMITDATITVLDGNGQKRYFNSGTGLYGVGGDGAKTPLSGLNANYFAAGPEETRTVPKVFQQVIFTGRGYGHGLGLSQWGARGMAEKGYKYPQIIEHYYNQDKKDGKLQISIGY